MKLRPFYRIQPNEWVLTTNPDVATAQARALAEPEKDERQIEEYIRQWILRELMETYSYPKDWLGERIVVEETVQMATMLKQADISIKEKGGKLEL